jgi:hypothetical protein
VPLAALSEFLECFFASFIDFGCNLWCKDSKKVPKHLQKGVDKELTTHFLLYSMVIYLAGLTSVAAQRHSSLGIAETKAGRKSDFGASIQGNSSMNTTLRLFFDCAIRSQSMSKASIQLWGCYHPSSLARSIKRYFEHNAEALEVLVLKGHKAIIFHSRNFFGKFFA